MKKLELITPGQILWEEFMEPRVYPSGNFFDPSIAYIEYEKYSCQKVYSKKMVITYVKSK